MSLPAVVICCCCGDVGVREIDLGGLGDCLRPMPGVGDLGLPGLSGDLDLDLDLDLEGVLERDLNSSEFAEGDL